MLRRSVLGIMILGVIVTLVGGAGVFAVFTDRATTGVNSVTSGELPSAAHLQITLMGNTLGDCTGFTDDLTTGLFTATDVQAGYAQDDHVCLKNAGSSVLNVSMSVIDLADVETACTGDEAAAGDTTCGGGAIGELSSALSTRISRFDCTTGQGSFQVTPSGAYLAGALFDVGSLAVGEVGCFNIQVNYGLNVPPDTMQKAQSDQTTWRFAFDGSTA